MLVGIIFESVCLERIERFICHHKSLSLNWKVVVIVWGHVILLYIDIVSILLLVRINQIFTAYCDVCLKI